MEYGGTESCELILQQTGKINTKIVENLIKKECLHRFETYMKL